jgi:hypothetical protein
VVVFFTSSVCEGGDERALIGLLVFYNNASNPLLHDKQYKVNMIDSVGGGFTSYICCDII